MMKIEKKILFIGKSNDIYSKQIIKILKRRFRFLKIFLCKGKNCKPNKKILNWKGDIIFSFRSYFILSKKFINKAKICAINFHPGPPSYRGIGCVNFALSNNENIYGCTAHLMDKKIDNGKIIDYKIFKISRKNSIDQVLTKTYKTQVKQVSSVIEKLVKENFRINKLYKNKKWSRKLYTRKELNDLYKIDININKFELQKKIRATKTKKFTPFIYLFGYKFFLK